MNVFEKDLYRYYGGKDAVVHRFRLPEEVKYIRTLRKCQNSRGLVRKINSFLLWRRSRKTHIQIPYNCKIGEGFYIGHFGRIIINSKAVIGKNVNIATGVTIGQENRGKRKGCPTIGNNVWIGTNAVIVGNITIGNDVLIAPLTFVNFDVPDHSVVIGNPGRIIFKENATADCICNVVD